MAYIRTMHAAGLGSAYVAPPAGWSQFRRGRSVGRPFSSAGRLEVLELSRGWGRGLGATATQVVGTAGGLATPFVTAAAAPATAAALGISASVAVPLVGAAFAGILLGVELLMNSGCGQSCVVTSQWANQAEEQLKQNIAQYFSLPAPRTAFDQQSALNIFDAIWNKLVQLCSQPGLSTAGENCIKDRQSGACKWHASSDSPYPGGPAAGACWNWFNGYRDPIARDADVASGVQGAVSSVEQAFSSITSGRSSGLLLPLGAAALLLWAVLS